MKHDNENNTEETVVRELPFEHRLYLHSLYTVLQTLGLLGLILISYWTCVSKFAPSYLCLLVAAVAMNLWYIIIKQNNEKALIDLYKNKDKSEAL